MNNYRTIPYQPIRISDDEMMLRARSFFELMQKRRSVRTLQKGLGQRYSGLCLQTAGSAQWSKSPALDILSCHRCRTQTPDPASRRRRRIQGLFHGGMPQEWLNDLSYSGTDWYKRIFGNSPAPLLYFANHTTWTNKANIKLLCTGVRWTSFVFFAAIQSLWFFTLTHTLSSNEFLQESCNVLEWEKPYLLIPVGIRQTTQKCRTFTGKTFQKLSPVMAHENQFFIANIQEHWLCGLLLIVRTSSGEFYSSGGDGMIVRWQLGKKKMEGVGEYRWTCFSLLHAKLGLRRDSRWPVPQVWDPKGQTAPFRMDFFK